MWLFKKNKFTASSRSEYEIRVYEWMELCKQRNLAERRAVEKCESVDDLLDFYLHRPNIIPPPVWED